MNAFDDSPNSPAANPAVSTSPRLPRAKLISGQPHHVIQSDPAADPLPRPAKRPEPTTVLLPVAALNARTTTSKAAPPATPLSTVRAPLESAQEWRRWLQKHAPDDVPAKKLMRLVSPLMQAFPGGPVTAIEASDKELLRLRGFGPGMLGVLRSAFAASGLAGDSSPEISGRVTIAAHVPHAADAPSVPAATARLPPTNPARRARKPVREIGGPPKDDAPLAADPSPPAASGATTARMETPRAEAAEHTARQIEVLHRRAMFCTGQRVSIGNRLAAFVRTSFLGFSTFGDEEAREKACKAAAKLIATARKGEPTGLGAEEELALRSLVLSTDAGAAAFVELEEQCLNRMVKLARTLPAFAFVQNTRGFGERSFARIVGEARALHLYANPAKLWKRLGLAVIGGERQRRHSDKELAIIHGYSPKRRSVSWVAFESCLRAQGGTDPVGEYRAFYDRKKAEYLERGWTKMHSHRAAARYAEKRLILRLWKAWRQDLRGHDSEGAQIPFAPQNSDGQQEG